ncbi:ATP-binding cassette sub-family C member 9-like [Limulus polyphemus]|uniref:ATP-binding cassette sub-family C member 9-like n=1 Tax=Limulus polyphemus TaxID=6850 RepID=A0ABM1TI25_LIMPO|nr:ATP-binding cassette sub-family C member 9-like [Limulus polyphemus]
MASVEMYMSAVERVDGYSRLPTESYGEEDAAVSQDWPASGEVTFENVTLSYDDDLDPVVRNVTLNIKPGEKVGICGRTGSGKSSLVMGLFRLLNISDGKIRIDGVNVTDIPLSTLRTKLSIIPQDAVMFSGTVRENLDPGNVHTDEELWKALETAQMKDLVISFSEGLDSLVLEEGANFSTGQRQLFCLARALLRQSRIIVLDEATSSLDRETDKALQTVVASSWVGCTVLAIAHRVTSILDFDNVVVLEAGRIVEKGSPKDLLAKRGGTFASLLRACQQQS